MMIRLPYVCVAISVLFAASVVAAVGDQGLVSVTVHLPRTGCAAVSPDSDATVSVWRADQYPGDDNPFPTEYHTKGGSLTIDVAPDYYRVMYSTAHCWEAFKWVVLLPNRPREITVAFPTWVAKDGVDYTIYHTPRGAVAGTIRPGLDRVTLEPLPRTSGRPSNLTAVVSQGAYYFDYVPVGSYRLQFYGANSVAPAEITVKNDAAQIIDQP